MKPTSRIPIYLSAFACPGLGQLVQRRWLAGGLFLMGFLLGFCWVMSIALRNIRAYYGMLTDWNTDPEIIPPSAFILPLLLVGAFYFANLIDVFTGQRRQIRAELDAEFRKEFPA
ncbi:hypothetical protein [Pontiella sp.]|uniref:hypothetical protein n=1 Tax=Pontiella sp. TaxID=2837462 RepID=UPI00356639A7